MCALQMCQWGFYKVTKINVLTYLVREIYEFWFQLLTLAYDKAHILLNAEEK